jgi:hypothetical protein
VSVKYLLLQVMSDGPEVVNFEDRAPYSVSMILISKTQDVRGATKGETLCFRRRKLLR